jgi:hypothetical protein
MFGAGHLFGRRAGIRDFGAPAELRNRKFTVKPLARAEHPCPPIEGHLSHWRTDGKTQVEYKCAGRAWKIQLDYYEEIEDALHAAKLVARHWRAVMQRGEPLSDDPTSDLPEGIGTQPFGSSRI